jgi:hypothetical protein
VVAGAVDGDVDLGVPTVALADMGADSFADAAALAEEAARSLAGRL